MKVEFLFYLHSPPFLGATGSFLQLGEIPGVLKIQGKLGQLEDL